MQITEVYHYLVMLIKFFNKSGQDSTIQEVHQAEFTKGCSTSDQNFILNEGCHEIGRYNKKFHVPFILFKSL